MRIVHLELAGFYNEGMSYQTNLLVEQNMRDGNVVSIISTNYQWFGAELKRIPAGNSFTSEGAQLIRIAYAPSFEKFNLHKFRKVRGLYKLLEDFAPDVILSHDLCYWSVLDVIRYKKHHPQVKLYADSHTDSSNSGTNWLSLHILHRLFYRQLMQKTIPYLEKYLVLSEETRQFNHHNYGVPQSLMEFYPLGGILPAPEEYAQSRTRKRAELGVREDEVLFVHSGKLDALKRTEDLLCAFAAVENPKARLAVIGSIPSDMESTLLPLMETDSRVVYLGWKSADELMEYLCAADLYCQPGSQSATMQNAVCCGCGVMLYPHKSYVSGFDYCNILWVKTQADMERVFAEIASGSVDLAALKENSHRCAHELLDYRKLAARLYR